MRDLGVVATVTDRGHRRPRNEDAMAIATADGRSVIVVCDGVASTANSHLASRAAADAALAVLERVLSTPKWPDASGIHDLMDAAFAEAQVAVTRVPEDEPDGNDVSPSTTLVAAIATPELVAVGNIGDSRGYWLSSLPSNSRLLTADDSWAQDSTRTASRRISPTHARTRTQSHDGSVAIPTLWCRRSPSWR